MIADTPASTTPIADTPASTTPIADSQPVQAPFSTTSASPRNPLARFALRFFHAYICLYALFALTNVTAFLSVPLRHGKFSFPVDEAFRTLVPWTGAHLLHLHQPITYKLSGDSPFSWIEHLLFLVIALAAALLWTALAQATHRHRHRSRAFDPWLRLLVRFSLASILLAYGFDKVFPIQFRSITRADLILPLGDLDHFQLMWHFMAASKPYTIFSGVLEVLAGVLLLVPPLANLGALVSVIVFTNIVALNFAYSIPVKLHSSNYLLLSIFLAAPLAPRLFRLLVLNRDTPRELPLPLSSHRLIDRTARIVPIVLGTLIFIAFLFEEHAHYHHVQKVAAAVVPLQGIWQVDRFSFPDGTERPLLTAKLAAEMHIPTGDDHWFRLVFDQPKQLVIQSLNGELDYVDLDLQSSNATAGASTTTATLTDSGDADWKVSFTLDQPQPNHMHIHGLVNGTRIDAALHRLDENNFPINDNTLHLINR